MAKIVEFGKKIYKLLKFNAQMHKLDKIWYFLGGNCFGIFPPSFYYTHTKEEIEQKKKETIKKLLEILNKYEDRL